MTYRCAACGDVCETGWSDAEANAEAEALWGVRQALTNPAFEVVCDDCWNRRSPAERDAMGREFKSERH